MGRYILVWERGVTVCGPGFFKFQILNCDLNWIFRLPGSATRGRVPQPVRLHGTRTSGDAEAARVAVEAAAARVEGTVGGGVLVAFGDTVGVNDMFVDCID